MLAVFTLFEINIVVCSWLQADVAAEPMTVPLPDPKPVVSPWAKGLEGLD
jgi:hypothetical protein